MNEFPREVLSNCFIYLLDNASYQLVHLTNTCLNPNSIANGVAQPLSIARPERLPGLSVDRQCLSILWQSKIVFHRLGE